MSLALSVVVPCYNEEDVIQATHERIAKSLSGLNCDFEILYVNDGSQDRTLDFLSGIAAQDPTVRIVNLAWNFGHQAAVSAGLEYSCGEAVLDADLQDPPELIGK